MLKKIFSHFRPTLNQGFGRTPKGAWHEVGNTYFLLLLSGQIMKTRQVISIIAAALTIALAPHTPAHAQTPEQIPQKSENGVMEFIVEGKDTFYIDKIRASRIFPKLQRQKGKDWRKYYRLVHNFSKTYPYALVARELLVEVDSTLEAENFSRAEREKYIKGQQKELFNVFETPLRNLTVSQGALLMRLIDREAGKSSYNIIKEYRNGIAAGFWQGIAKIFGSDLKKHYDAEGADRSVEDLVQKWEDGDFDNFYYSLFWQYPPKVVIPEEYAKKMAARSNPSK